MIPIISVEHVTKSFPTTAGEVVAVNDVSFSVEQGDIFGIIGLSGAGKSTLVRTLNLLERPVSGKVVVDGNDLTESTEKELREARKNIGMIFQHFNLLQQRNILDNVCFPLEIAGVKKKEARKRAMELLRTVGLSDKAKAYPSQLSGGQKQRVAIARVLTTNPKILLCDEATSALDPQTTKSILELLRELNSTLGITIVLITHEMSVVEKICNRVVVLENGAIAEQGSVEEIFRSPRTEAARKLLLNAGTRVEQMSGQKLLRVTFSEGNAYAPVLGNLILDFKTPVNILYANTRTISGKAVGEMILQLPEMPEVAKAMEEALREQGLGVESVSYEEWKGVSENV